MARDAIVAAASAALLLPFGLSVGTAAVWSLALLVAAPGAIAAAGGYGWRTLGEGAIEQRLVLRAGGSVLVALMVLGYLGLVAVPVPVVVASVPAAVVATMLSRHLAALRLVRRRAQGDDRLRAVLVGSAGSVRNLLAQIRQAPGAGYDVVGWCRSSGEQGAVEAVPALGELTELERIGGLAVEQEADVVMLVGEHDGEAARRASWALAGTPASLVVVPVVAELASSRVRVRPTNGLSLINISEPTRPTT